MDLQGSDYVMCPHCGHQYDVTIEEMRVHEGLGIENSDSEFCEECNEQFLIVEYPEFFTIEEPEIEDDEDVETEDD